jgi:hypothetical protein
VAMLTIVMMIVIITAAAVIITSSVANCWGIWIYWLRIMSIHHQSIAAINIVTWCVSYLVFVAVYVMLIPTLQASVCNSLLWLNGLIYMYMYI